MKTFLVLLIVTAAVSMTAAAADAPLIEAARKNDIATLGALVRQRAEVNAQAGDGSTALLWAAHRSNLEAARMLIAAGANPKLGNRLGMTPLLLASRLGDAPMIDALVKAGADPHAAGPEGETPLMAASAIGNIDAVKLLLARRVNVNAQEQWQKQTALMWAAGNGHLAVVQALLRAGANPNLVAKNTEVPHTKGDDGRMWVDHPSGGLTALLLAAREGRLDVARVLVEAGADVTHANPDGLTAMLIAVVNDRLDLAAMLLEHGANPNDGSLYESIQMHNLRTNETTGEATRPRLDHPNRLTPIDIATRLVEKGADPNRLAKHTLHIDGTGQPDPVNEAPVFRAARAQDVAMLRLLLGKGGNANVVSATGQAAIMAAMGGGRGSFVGGFGAVPGPFRYDSDRSPLDAMRAASRRSTLLWASARRRRLRVVPGPHRPRRCRSRRRSPCSRS